MLKVASVQYYNSIPFQFALNQLQERGLLEWVAATPSECSRLLKEGKVDIALLPVGAALDYERLFVVSDYCIACEREVRTVKLFYNCGWDQIRQVVLDKDSRTSNLLVKYVNQHFWKRTDFQFVHSGEARNDLETAWLRIGDEAFVFEKKFKNARDLGAEWRSGTGLPFVFALWVSVDRQDQQLIHIINNAFKEYIGHIPKLLETYAEEIQSQLIPYFRENISFQLDEPKKKAIDKFLTWAGNSNPLCF